jgi:hypothetical protein
MPHRLITIALHILAWVLFFSLPLLLTPNVRSMEDSRAAVRRMEARSHGIHPDSLFTASRLPPAPPPVLQFPFNLILVLSNLLLVVFFYFNGGWLLPKVWQARGTLPYLGGILCSGAVVIGIPLWIRGILVSRLASDEIALSEPPFNGFGILVMFVIFGLSWAISCGIWFAGAFRKSEQRRIESDHARLQAELSQLKAQINPHFLFNTLNGIYTLTLTKSDQASDAVMQLSGLLRYVLSEGSADFVPVEQDVAQLRTFVQLHQLRLTGQTPVTFAVEGTPEPGRQIAPLLLLPFAENAFKFGVSTREFAPIDIRIGHHPNRLEFHCKNKIIRRDVLGAEPSGIGIANTKRRLELIYPGKHRLETSEQAGFFEVSLTIYLTD